MAPRRPAVQAGFSLVESLVGLALLGIVLMLSLGVLWLQPGAERRARAHGEALRAMEGALESLRAGATLPTDDRPLDQALLPLPEEPAATALQVWLELSAEPGASGLYRVLLRSRYKVDGKVYERQLESRLWRP